MSRPHDTRRAVAVLQSGPGHAARPMIGSRSLHQYWALLMPHFRGILLPPQCRSADASTQWSWREPIDNPPLSSADLATVRKRLTGAQRSLADAAEDSPVSATTATQRTAAVLPPVAARMQEIVAALAARPDPALAAYVVRSDRGLMLHSWDLAAALAPQYPDATSCEIAGTVLVANAPANDCEVRLEAIDGASLARTQTDAAGRFRFPRILSGRYRLRAVSTQVAFPPEGVSVEIENTSVTDIELRDRAADRTAGGQAPGSTHGPRRHLGLFLLLTLLALVVAGAVWWSKSVSRPQPLAPSAASIGVNVAPDTLAQARTDTVKPVSSANSSSISTPPRSPVAKTEPATAPPPRESTRSQPVDLPPRDSGHPRTVLIARPVAGFAVDFTGAPASAALPPSAAPTGVSSVNSSTAGNALSGAGTATAGNVSPATSASTAAAASASAGTSAALGAAASNSAAVATASPATPTPSKQTTPPATPPIAPASSSMASAPPTASPVQFTPALSPAAEATRANADTASTDRSSSAAPAPDSRTAPASAPTPATPDSHSKDPAPDRAPPDDHAVSAADTTGPDAPASSAPSTTRPSTEGLAYPTTVVATAPAWRRMRLRLTTWQLRLLQDAILPTMPTRASDDDPIEALRERLLRERRTQVPLTLKNPVSQIGFVVALPAAAIGAHQPHWRDATGAAPAFATVLGDRAEIFWPGSSPPPADYTLLADDGHDLARVTADEHGDVTLATAPGVSGWPWIGIERAPADDPALTAAEWTARFAWQVLGGTPAPATWRRDDHWRAHRGHRLDLILGDNAGGLATRALALIDRVTGWALVTSLEQAPEIPETTDPHPP